MPQTTIIVATDTPREIAALESWLARWQDSLTFLSGEKGCGCCVRMVDVEGPQEAIETFRCCCEDQASGVRLDEHFTLTA